MAQTDADIIKTLREGLKTLRMSAKGFWDETRAATAEELNGQRKLVKELEASYKKLSDTNKAEGKEILSQIQNLRKELQNMVQVTGTITNEVKSITTNMMMFLRSTGSQYRLAQQIAKEYKLVARDIGLGGQGADNMVKSFKDALPAIMEMGFSAEDTKRIYTEMAEVSGRITPVSAADAQRIAGIAGATGMMADTTTRMAEGFRLMGVESGAMEDLVFSTYKQAQKLGLNANKVIKVLADNMKSMQSYSFAGGVKGMTEMAKQAVKMRLDVSDVLQMADKFYHPEAAIEAAANLQMLGGDIAEAFGDPFETMYLARNKPEELAERLGDMTENMMTFNSETGQYEFPAEVRMQLKAAGEQLGINTDKMIEMARQTSKIKDIQMKFTSIGDEESRENLASLAQWSEEKGDFVIKHKGEEFGLDEIGDGMADEIMSANQTQEQNIGDIAINTQTMSEKLDSMEKSLQARAATATNIYEITAGEIESTVLGPLKKSMESAVGGFLDTVGANMSNIISEAGLADEMQGEIDELDKFGEALRKNGVDSLDSFSKAVGTFINDVLPITNTVNEKTDAGDIDPGDIEGEDDFISLPGGDRYFSGAKGTVKINNDDIIVAGTSLLGNQTGSNVSGSIDVNFSNAVIRLESDSGGVSLDMDKIKDAIQPIIINALNNKSRNGGVLSSKEAVDNGLTV